MVNDRASAVVVSRRGWWSPTLGCRVRVGCLVAVRILAMVWGVDRKSSIRLLSPGLDSLA
jgi:hypothetical protein